MATRLSTKKRALPEDEGFEGSYEVEVAASLEEEASTILAEAMNQFLVKDTSNYKELINNLSLHSSFAVEEAVILSIERRTVVTASNNNAAVTDIYTCFQPVKDVSKIKRALALDQKLK